MATRKWRGDAKAVAQVDSCSITANDVATTYILTINGKTVSVAGNAGGAASTATDLAAAWNASTIPECTEITASSASSAVSLTADTAGVPHTVTSSVSGGAGTISAISTTTTSSGPKDLNIAANWTGATLPTTGDDVVFEACSVDALYNLSALSAITLTSLTVKASYTGKIGLPEINALGYQEYRTTYLTLGATTVTIGQSGGSGSGRVKLNTGSVQTSITVQSTGSSADSNLESVLWKGTHASNVLTVLGGSVGVAPFAGETATMATERVAGGTVRNYGGCTMTTITQGDGTLELAGAVTTLNLHGGTCTLIQSSPAPVITTLNARAGTIKAKAGITITTLTLNKGAIYDASEDNRAKTVTNCTIYAGSTITDPDKTTSWTNGIVVTGCRLVDLAAIDLGSGLTITVA